MAELEATVDRIFMTRRITRDDQKLLMGFFSHKTLSYSEKMLVNRIFDALRQGRLRVVD